MTEEEIAYDLYERDAAILSMMAWLVYHIGLGGPLSHWMHPYFWYRYTCFNLTVYTVSLAIGSGRSLRSYFLQTLLSGLLCLSIVSLRTPF